MTYNSLLAIHHNTTTVDSLTRANRVYHFAIHMPEVTPAPEATPPFSTITYPLLDPSTQVQPRQQRPRTFAILPSPQGSNPYLLSSAISNWKAVLGDNWYDWLLPFKYSPCCRYASNSHRTDSTPSFMYEMGPVLEKMKREAGLLPQTEKTLETDRYGRRRIRDRSSG